jgi:hypothetical protein
MLLSDRIKSSLNQEALKEWMVHVGVPWDVVYTPVMQQTHFWNGSLSSCFLNATEAVRPYNMVIKVSFVDPTGGKSRPDLFTARP